MDADIDSEMMEWARDAAVESNCKKKQLGCVLLLKNWGVITGANVVPSGVVACDRCRRDGDGGPKTLYKCRAVHAERAVLMKAAKEGLSTDGSVLYSYMGVPCGHCLIELIMAGVKEIVCKDAGFYDILSKSILQEWVNSGGKFRVINVTE